MDEVVEGSVIGFFSVAGCILFGICVWCCKSHQSFKKSSSNQDLTSVQVDNPTQIPDEEQQ